METVAFSTQGDRVLDRPLAAIGGKGLFIKELEEALQRGAADIAVHSMKDVPAELPPGFALSAVLKREDPRDALIGPAASLEAIRIGARVGTSSLRRQCQLRALRPDLQVISVRGNLDTRLRKLDGGEFDVLVLAAAGLKRLALDDRIAACLDPRQMLPAIGQGVLAIECRIGDDRVGELLAPLDHPETHVCVTAERALGGFLGGSCEVPIAAHAEIRAGRLHLSALVGRVDGSEIVRGRLSGDPGGAVALGRALAEDLAGRGAEAILRDCAVPAAG